MSAASTTPVPNVKSSRVAYLRHVYVLDADLNVLLSGSAPDHLDERPDDELAPEVAAEIRKLVATHDFIRRPVATGLVGAEIGLRISRTPGAGGPYYTVFSERIRLARRLRMLGRRFALTPRETELLRLVAGGYTFAVMAMRLELGATTLRTDLRELERKVECIGRKELALLALSAEPPANSPSRASFPGANSSTYPAPRAGNRRR